MAKKKQNLRTIKNNIDKSNSRTNKILFENRFNLFWQNLNKKKKLPTDYEVYFHKTMLKHFNELLKIENLNVDTSLHYVFNIPNGIINIYERANLRRAGSSKDIVYLEVINYYLNNIVTEADACGEIMRRNNFKGQKRDFVNQFRRWYNDIVNKDIYSEISQYTSIKPKRKTELLLKKEGITFQLSPTDIQ